jgi:hypothetical protein
VAVLIFLCQETPFNYIEAISVPLNEMFLGFGRYAI